MAQEALVRYSERRVGGTTARVQRPIEHDDRGEPTKFQVFPVRTWGGQHQQMWLPLDEARLWAGLRDWSIVQTRGNSDDSEQEVAPMKEALIEYRGRKRGRFGQRIGKFPVRQWAAVPPDNEKWLPVAEAELWDAQLDWRITRTRTRADVAPTPVAEMAQPAPPAISMATLLDQAQADIEKVSVVEAEPEPPFCISDSGVIHHRGCIQWPNYPLKEFDSFGDAVNSEEYAEAKRARVHKACCKEQMVALTQTEEVDMAGAIEQMNALGESYGIQATEA
jgi:hypothetical protein